jgi:hypothetical protein
LHGLPVAYGITRTEEDPQMEFIYKNFKKEIDASKIKTIFVDKDLKNIKLLEEFFPNVKILLCTFHVIKYLHKEISGLPLAILQKRELMEIIREMLYSENLDKYKEFHQKLQKYEDDVPDFISYFDRCWNDCKEMWVQFYRNESVIFGTHTNNHIESYHRAIKRVLNSNCNLFQMIERLMSITRTFQRRQGAYKLKDIKKSNNRYAKCLLICKYKFLIKLIIF